MLLRCCYVLVIFEVLLGMAHLLWPESRWGPGWRSYFSFNNRFTLVSWLASMQLFGVSVLAFLGFHGDRQPRHTALSHGAWTWWFGALVALVLSLAEMTRLHRRFELLGSSALEVYGQLVLFPLWFMLLVWFGGIVLLRLRQVPGHSTYAVGWLIAWGTDLCLTMLSHSPVFLQGWHPAFTLVKSLAYLFGCTLLLMSLGGYVLRSPVAARIPAPAEPSRSVLFPVDSRHTGMLLGVGGITFNTIFLHLLLSRMLTVFGDHLTANSVITIALLGIAAGGLIGALTAPVAALPAMIGASLLLPVSILVAFGMPISFTNTPELASILLTLPVVCSSTVIMVALARSQSYVRYGIDRLGAAVSASLVRSPYGPRRAHQVVASTAAAPTPSRYIVSPTYDWMLFLLPPVLALGLGILISGTAFADRKFAFRGHEVTWSALVIGIFIHAHLVIVFFRSYGNPGIFRQHRLRFLAAPVLLYGLMMSSKWLLVAVVVLGTFWDIYHSGLQTFGFARIYDKKRGNDAAVGRRLDWWLNHLFYAGPILAGATMLDHVKDFKKFESVGSTFFTAIPAFMQSHQRYITWAVLGLGTLFLAYYLGAYWRLHRQGYQVSLLKVYLLVSTGLCSIYTWGFNSWGEAFFIMNFFHALQYFGLVWAFEHTNMMRLLRIETLRLRESLTACCFLGLAFAYGYWVMALDADIEWLLGITVVVSILHFWYDGFIWSVRQQQV